MEKALKWGFTEWNQVPIFFSKTNKKYYWAKCKTHLSSKHVVELLGDVTQIQECFAVTEQMLNSIWHFAVENHLESELEMVLTESKSFSCDLQLLNLELSDVIERQESFRLKELEDKAFTLKSSIEQSHFYFEYLYLKEIFSIRHKADSKSVFLAAVEVKAEGIAEKKWLRLKEEFVKVLDSVEQNYKSKIDTVMMEANAKFETMKLELEQKLCVQADRYKTDTEKLQKDIESFQNKNNLVINKLTEENKTLKEEWEKNKFKLLTENEESIL